MWIDYEMPNGDKWERQEIEGGHLSRQVGSGYVNVTMRAGAYTAATAVVTPASVDAAVAILRAASAELEAAGAFRF